MIFFLVSGNVGISREDLRETLNTTLLVKRTSMRKTKKINLQNKRPYRVSYYIQILCTQKLERKSFGKKENNGKVRV